MPFILPARTLDSGYEVSNSIRFRPAGSSQMSQGNGTPTNAKKWTISFWVKIAFDTSSSGQRCVYSSTGSSSNGSFVQFSDTAMKVGCQGVSETDWVRFLGTTTIQFRDPSAFYHFCFGFDSTQGTDTNRIRSYVNGTEVGYLASEGNYPSQNDDSNFNNGSDCALGKNITTNDSYLDGYVSQFYFIDGTQYAASDFGETDEDSGIWKPKAFSGTFGNNGTFVEGDSNTADASGNGNNFGQSNTVITTDTPTNNFATLTIARTPPLSGAVFSEGNTHFVTGSTGGSRNMGRTAYGNIPVNKGKWYYEVKLGHANLFVGAAAVETAILQEDVSGTRYTYYYGATGEIYINTSGSETSPNYAASSSINDILGFALDVDNNRLYVRNSGGWSDGSGNFDEADINDFESTSYSGASTDLEGYVVPAFSSSSGSTSMSGTINFGNPAFTISSGNADANGYGNFEYAVPSGFYSLCTKNLAEYG